MRSISARFSDSPLREIAFSRLLAAYTFAGLGHQFTLIALLWLVLNETDSGATLGLVVIAMQFPGVISSPLFGHFFDRIQPRTILVVDNVLRAMIILLIPVLYWFGHLSMPAILILASLAGLLSPATAIGVQVLLPDLVPDEDLDNANALISLGLNLPFFLGPAIAGLLISIWGAPVVILIDAVAFAIMAIACWSLPAISRLSSQRETSSSAGRAWMGFGVLFQFPSVLVITILSFVFNFSYGPLEPALPIYARDTLRAGATEYGLLWTGMGAGILAGLVAIPLLRRVTAQGAVFATIAILWGAFLLPMAFTSNLHVAVTLLVLAGAAWGPYSTMRNTLIQRLVPPHFRGQVFGAQYMVTVIGSPLGALAGGFMLGFLSAPQVIGISGVACIVAGLAALVSPALRSVRTAAYSI